MKKDTDEEEDGMEEEEGEDRWMEEGKTCKRTIPESDPKTAVHGVHPSQ